MTNQSNPVWQMAYAVEFARQLDEYLSCNEWPDDDQLKHLADEAKTVADAAVEALGEQEAKLGPTQTSQAFPERMRAIRESNGLTQADLAKATGLQPSAISHFETGNRAPSFENLQRIAIGLNVSLDTLIGRAEVSWLVEGLKQAKREADECPALRKRVTEHPSGLIGEQEPQPVATPQPRDESKDVWLPAFVLDEAITKADARTGRILPECNTSYSRLGFRRYVPYSQLEAVMARVVPVKVAEVHEANRLIDSLTRDSELLDAILEASQVGVYSPHVRVAIRSAIDERAKR